MPKLRASKRRILLEELICIRIATVIDVTIRDAQQHDLAIGRVADAAEDRVLQQYARGLAGDVDFNLRVSRRTVCNTAFNSIKAWQSTNGVAVRRR